MKLEYKGSEDLVPRDCYFLVCHLSVGFTILPLKLEYLLPERSFVFQSYQDDEGQL